MRQENIHKRNYKNKSTVFFQHSVGNDRGVYNGSQSVALFRKALLASFLKWHLLSVYTLSLAPSLARLWHILSREVKWYLKFRSLTLKEINSGFRWFFCPSTCDSWHAAGVSWPSSLSSLSFPQGFLHPPERTQTPVQFLRSLAFLWIKPNVIKCVFGENVANQTK